MRSIAFQWILGKTLCLIFIFSQSVKAQSLDGQWVRDTFWGVFRTPKEPDFEDRTQFGLSMMIGRDEPCSLQPRILFLCPVFRSSNPLVRSDLYFIHTPTLEWKIINGYPDYKIHNNIPHTVVAEKILEKYRVIFEFTGPPYPWPFPCDSIVHRLTLGPSWQKLLYEIPYDECPDTDHRLKKDRTHCYLDYYMVILEGRIKYFGDLFYTYPNYAFELEPNQTLDVNVLHNYGGLWMLDDPLYYFELNTPGFFERKKLPMYYFETLDHMEVIFSEGVKKP